MFARASISTPSEAAASRFRAPRSTVSPCRSSKDNTVETRRVRVGLTSDTQTEILEGVDVGEIVVADAGSSLHDGDQIKTMFADELDRKRSR
jgi:multidrug efflux pump subunit AcrA (membrane-fusion protein)